LWFQSCPFLAIYSIHSTTRETRRIPMSASPPQSAAAVAFGWNAHGQLGSMGSEGGSGSEIEALSTLSSPEEGVTVSGTHFPVRLRSIADPYDAPGGSVPSAKMAACPPREKEGQIDGSSRLCSPFGAESAREFDVVAAAGGGHHFVTLAVAQSGNKEQTEKGETRVHVWGKALGDHTVFWAPRVVSEPFLLGNSDAMLAMRSLCNRPEYRVTSVAAGGDHVLLLTEAGDVWSFGCGFFGRLGHGDCRNDPKCRRIGWFMERQRRAEFGVPIAIGAGGNASAVVCRRGDDAETTTFTFGYGTHLQLGLGDGDAARAENHSLPEVVPGVRGQDIVQVSCGDRFMIARSSDGSLFSWGTGEHGELGRGRKDAMSGVPRRIQFGALVDMRVLDVQCGGQHVLALTDRGVWSWGRSEYGRLGYTRRGPQFVPQEITELSSLHEEEDEIVTISCGQAHSACVSRDGRLFMFGWNKVG
jgi:alpha-tubulin suppressor-like RCC1 family protein